jgi:hypothetical protein
MQALKLKDTAKTTYFATVVIYDRKMFIRWSAQKSFKIVIYNCKEHLC